MLALISNTKDISKLTDIVVTQISLDHKRLIDYVNQVSALKRVEMILEDIYKENFLYLRDTIEELLQLIVDKIIIMPYPLRCICKIINILISKKFPGLTKYEVNSFIGQFILDKCIFPILLFSYIVHL